MRLIVPAGYMLDVSHGSIMVELCSGAGPMRMAMAMPGMGHQDGGREHGKTEQPCAFAGLAAPALGGADPILLAVAILFIMAVGRCAAPTLSRPRAPRLRPPLRGPPSAS